jgi:hypothetical protein
MAPNILRLLVGAGVVLTAFALPRPQQLPLPVKRNPQNAYGTYFLLLFVSFFVSVDNIVLYPLRCFN